MSTFDVMTDFDKQTIEYVKRDLRKAIKQFADYGMHLLEAIEKIADGELSREEMLIVAKKALDEAVETSKKRCVEASLRGFFNPFS